MNRLIDTCEQTEIDKISVLLGIEINLSLSLLKFAYLFLDSIERMNEQSPRRLLSTTIFINVRKYLYVDSVKRSQNKSTVQYLGPHSRKKKLNNDTLVDCRPQGLQIMKTK